MQPIHYELIPQIADICDEWRMHQIINAFAPEVILHAAAYKHVPLMECNEREAIKNNIFGTKVLADLSVRSGVSKFVLISTDKAVDPSSVMGATKRIAEQYLQAIGNETSTQFMAVRFGNVLGSHGSVVPLFKEQIQNGGPVTVTDPRVTRYFMTVQEACQLVLQAASMGKGGEIFVLDMGRPLNIRDLAFDMIRLSGFEPNVDISVKYVGLRPGEKLEESLHSALEKIQDTTHEKIQVIKSYSQPIMINEELAHLEELLNDGSALALRSALKSMLRAQQLKPKLSAELTLKLTSEQLKHHRETLHVASP